MHFLALATDYDGTLAEDGVVAPPTIAALEKLKRTGRRVVLVTGRELPELKRVFEKIAICDRIVAENGALLYNPNTGEERVLVPPPPALFVETLRQRGVEPLSVGRAILATWEPNETKVLEVIHDLGLEYQITFNKGAVMVLPTGTNKAAGLIPALDELGISPERVVGIGDAENDHAFLRACGCAAAVANALPAVKDEADIRLLGARGAGVIELIEMILEREEALIRSEQRRRRSLIPETARLGTHGNTDQSGRRTDPAVP